MSSIEGPGQLLTNVVRQSDGSPLSNWIVRYTILGDGLDARLDEEAAKRLDVLTDATGRAIVNVYPQTGRLGTTRVGIQIIKPRTLGGEPEHMIVGQGIGYVTWSETEPARPLLPPTEIPSLPTEVDTSPPPFPPEDTPPFDSGTSDPPDVSF